MKLQEYLQIKNLTQTEFSKISGVRQTLISRHILRKGLPSSQNLFRYTKATSGLVTAEDFLDDVETPSSPVV